jgi:pimeloyl-ACP methyl ester carboxylesterase
MGTFVLCHGGWSGGWQWKPVAKRLRDAGHEVYTPTFTGLGERVHLASRDVDLHTYIQDILMVLHYEALHDVILVGYSISGPVISGVAEQAADRITHLFYLDAYVLDDGQSMADQAGPEIMGQLLEAAQLAGEGWRLPHDPPDADRRTDQSLMPVLTPLQLQSAAAADLPRTFVLCTDGGQDIGPLHFPIEQAAARAKLDDRWRYRELKTGHMPMWTAPEELTALLLEIV